MRIICSILLFIAITTTLYGQSLTDTECDCVRNLYLDVNSWAKIQEERRSLTGFNQSTAIPMEQAQDFKETIDGFIHTIGTSNYHDCPTKLYQLTDNAVLYARHLSRAYVKAMEIKRRVDAGRSIPKQELGQVDREMTRSLSNWEGIIPLLDAELKLQYSQID